MAIRSKIRLITVNKYNQECIKLRTFVAVTSCCTNGVARRIFRKLIKFVFFIKLEGCTIVARMFYESLLTKKRCMLQV